MDLFQHGRCGNAGEGSRRKSSGVVRQKQLMISARTLIRHLSAAALLFGGWKFLNSWYKFQHSTDYLIFAALTIIGLTIGAGPFLLAEIKNISQFKILICLPLILLLLPWAEWLQLGTIYTRESWSEKLFLEAIFVYALISIFRVFRIIPTKIHGSIVPILEKIASRRLLIWLPPIALFAITSYVALFIYRETSIVPDSATHLFQAHIFGKFKLFAAAPPVAEAFTGPFDLLVIKNSKWFGFGFPAFALLMAPATWLNLEWLISPLLAALTAAIWIDYARRWHGMLTAVVVGILLLLCPFIIVMSSTVMVFTPELFFASAVIYFCRLSLEHPTFQSRLLLSLSLAGAILVRPFSILPFLFPIVSYTFFQGFIQKRRWISAAIILGLITGISTLLVFQWKTTGDPFLSGYRVEVPQQKWGFGAETWETYAPLTAIGNLSNNLLGLNEWLGGWYSGSMLFVIAFFLRNKIQKWDKLLLACCGLLILFYFFFFIQDLFFGPRFYYLLTPILLLFIARAITDPQSLTLSGRTILVPFFVLTILISVPKHLPGFVKRFSPANSQAAQLKNEIKKNGSKKTLVFLDKSVGQNFVNWNDPFLKSPVIICRDVGNQNLEVQKHFPDYHPVWFRNSISMDKGVITSGFKFSEDPEVKREAPLNLFELAMALQAASDYSRRDFFDITYVDLFNSPETEKMYEFLEVAENQRVKGGEYKRQFRKGVTHAGKMLLLPKLAFEAKGDAWYSGLDLPRFRREFEDSRQSFVKAGNIGVTILNEMQKVESRIDSNSDQELSDSEIRSFLNEKIKLLKRGGSL
jgi:hypothetical protein